MNKHELFDIPLHECILNGAKDVIEAAVGQELPRFFVEYEPRPDDFDEDKDELQITVRYYEAIDFNGTCWDTEGSFSVPECIFKGIAARRPEDLQAFVDILLPSYRAESISMGLQHEFHNDLRDVDPEDDFFSSADDERMLSDTEVSELMHRFGTAPWFICNVGVEAVSKELFRLEIDFHDDKAFDTISQESVDHDLLTLSTSLSWEEYKAAMSDKGRLLRLLCRLHETFIVTKADLPGRYSAELKRELERRDWEEEDEDDPFTSGELMLDANGRTHFTRDYRE